MATEFEIKLRAGNVRQLEKILKDPQVAGHALEKLREIHMKTTYYDTADGALTARRWMLPASATHAASGNARGILPRRQSRR